MVAIGATHKHFPNCLGQVKMRFWQVFWNVQYPGEMLPKIGQTCVFLCEFWEFPC